MGIDASDGAASTAGTTGVLKLSDPDGTFRRRLGDLNNVLRRSRPAPRARLTFEQSGACSKSRIRMRADEMSKISETFRNENGHFRSSDAIQRCASR